MGTIFFACNLDGAPIDPEVLAGAIGCVAHRCPDGNWTWSDGPVALAQADLATLPEDRPGEPLVHGPFRIAADCRVDNRAELRRALPDADLRSDAPDAAYILAAYAAWGDACVERIIGDFAFVIWDGARRRLCAARDLSGARQLFVYHDRRRLIVASDRTQIFQDATIPLEVDDDQLLEYLTPAYQWTSGWDLGWFRNLHAVPAGYTLVAEHGHVQVRPFWSWTDVSPDRRPTAAMLDEYLAVLDESVRCRLRTRDRRVALELSGGLDSTAVVCLAARAGGTAELHSFSQVFMHEGGTEERWRIERVVATSGVTAHYLAGTSDYAPGYPVIEQYDRGLLSPHEIELLAGGYQFYGAMRAADCRVVLTGLMGDSLNEGNDRLAYDLLRRGRVGEALRRLRILWREDGRTALGALLYYGLLPFVPWPVLRPALVGLTLREGPYTTLPGYFTVAARERILAHDQNLRLRPLIRLQTRSPAAQPILGELRPMPALTYSKLTGLEMRHPYADRRLIELVLAMAPEERWDPVGTSYVAANRWHHRRALAGIVPAAVLAQQSGFDFGAAIATQYGGAQAQRWLSAAPACHLVERGLVCRDRLRHALGAPPDNLSYLNSLLSLEAWLRALASDGALRCAVPPRKAAPHARALHLPTAAQRDFQHAPA